MFLLDTNVISELIRPAPNPGVDAWLRGAEEDRVFLSVASIAEIRHGVERLPTGRRRDALAAWLSKDLPRRFQGRIIPIDYRVADLWGVLVARAQKAGRTLGVMDAFFAATAHAHALTLVTRNVRDFRELDIRVINPWRGEAAG
jgi:predicted nucleic acid-binding protein